MPNPVTRSTRYWGIGWGSFAINRLYECHRFWQAAGKFEQG
jgi:hypothetical protein